MSQNEIGLPEIYKEWLALRRRIDVPEGFSAQVMETIAKHATPRNLEQTRGEIQDLHMPLRWSKRLALLGSLFALGIFRITFIAHNLLLP